MAAAAMVGRATTVTAVVTSSRITSRAIRTRVRAVIVGATKAKTTKKITNNSIAFQAEGSMSKEKKALTTTSSSTKYSL